MYEQGYSSFMYIFTFKDKYLNVHTELNLKKNTKSFNTPPPLPICHLHCNIVISLSYNFL